MARVKQYKPKRTTRAQDMAFMEQALSGALLELNALASTQGPDAAVSVFGRKLSMLRDAVAAMRSEKLVQLLDRVERRHLELTKVAGAK